MTPGYEPMEGRRRAIVVVLVAVVGLDLVAVISSVMELGLLGRLDRGEVVGDAELDANDDRQAFIGLLQTLLFFIAAVFFIRWLRLGYRNVDVLTPGLRRYGHGWAIGAWFIPLFNLWRPKQIINDVWRAGAARSPGTEPLGVALNAWWALWVVDNVLSQVALRLSGGAAELDEIRTASAAYVATDGFDALTAVLAILVVRRVTERLEARARVEARSQHEQPAAAGPDARPSGWEVPSPPPSAAAAPTSSDGPPAGWQPPLPPSGRERR